MSHYERCRECIGRPVSIRMKDGEVYRGIIDQVDRRQVYLRPLGNRGLGGFGYGFGGGYGRGWGLALAGIAAISILFFW